jgi:hypothetical protein
LDFHDGGEIALHHPLALFNSAKPLITIPAMAWANTSWVRRNTPNPDPAPGVVVEEADSRVLKG